jgi:ribonuclease HII
MLKTYYTNNLIEAGCDEAGRGCLAGPVFAAAVVLPKKFKHPLLDDSKKMNATDRVVLREYIQQHALSFAVQMVTNAQIDKINILQASYKAMHKALDKLHIEPELILVDGNRFYNYKRIPHHCIVQGDGIYASIAAASVLAKTYRDDYMLKIHQEFPTYNWEQNKGYPTEAHRQAIEKIGFSKYHRLTFKVKPVLPSLFA